MADVIALDAETQRIEVNGIQLAFRRLGPQTGVPLFLCQRFRGTMDHWDWALLNLLAAERNIVVFDSAGVGRSEGLVPDDIAGMARIVASLASALGYDQIDVLGWSMGGAVAQLLALQNPSLVRRLILAATGPGGVPDAPRAPDKVWQIAGKPQNDDEDFLYLFFTEDADSRAAGLSSLRRLDERLSISRSAVAPESVKKQVGAIGAWGQGHNSAYQRLGEIAAPALIANGVHDVMTHAYNSYVMAQKMPNAQLILYPRAGHGFLFQYPELFGRHVLEFLR